MWKPARWKRCRANYSAEDSEEDDKEYREGDDPEWDLALKIVSGENYERLPTGHDIHEWSIMEEFAQSVTSGRISRELQGALHGSGAFGHFRSAIRRLRIERDWYAFRDNALREIAKGWCADRGLEWK